MAQNQNNSMNIGTFFEINLGLTSVLVASICWQTKTNRFYLFLGGDFSIADESSICCGNQYNSWKLVCHSSRMLEATSTWKFAKGAPAHLDRSGEACGKMEKNKKAKQQYRSKKALPLAAPPRPRP